MAWPCGRWRSADENLRASARPAQPDTGGESVVRRHLHQGHHARRKASPNATPYETIDNALRDVVRRSHGITGAARIIPWYQDFTLCPPRYAAEQVRLQILAGYANGFPSWMLWNPGSRYSEAALQKDPVAPPGK